MSKRQLFGPYVLSFTEVTAVVARRSPGVFAIGYLDAREIFRITFVSRADEDLRSALCQKIGSNNMFKFTYCATSRRAFELECNLFHDFHPPANCLHPSRALGSDWVCPVCAPK